MLRERLEHVLPDGKGQGLYDSNRFEDFFQGHLHQAVALGLETFVFLDLALEIGHILGDRVDLDLGFLAKGVHLFVEKVREFFRQGLEVVEVVDLGGEFDCVSVDAVDGIDSKLEGIPQVLIVTHVVISHLVHVFLPLLVLLDKLAVLSPDLRELIRDLPHLLLIVQEAEWPILSVCLFKQL